MRISNVIVWTMVATALTAPAAAQSTAETGAGIRIGAAYSRLPETVLGQKYSNNGFQADAAIAFLAFGRMRLDAVGDFTLHRNTFFDDQIVSVFGGARWSIRIGRVVPFAQFLAGLEQTSARGLATEIGGGADIWLTRRLAARVSVGSRRAKYDSAPPDTGETFSARRVGVGVVFALGK